MFLFGQIFPMCNSPRSTGSSSPISSSSSSSSSCSNSNSNSIDHVCYEVIKQYFKEQNTSLFDGEKRQYNISPKGVGISPKGISKVCNILKIIEDDSYDSIFNNITFNDFDNDDHKTNVPYNDSSIVSYVNSSKNVEHEQWRYNHMKYRFDYDINILQKQPSNSKDIKITMHNYQSLVQCCPEITQYATFIESDDNMIKIENVFDIQREWAKKFDDCKPITFRMVNGDTALVNGMSASFTNGNYFSNSEYSAIKFSTFDHQYTFEIILPNSNFNVMNLSFDDINNINYANANIFATIPKFSVKNKINIFDYFNKNGVNFNRYKIKLDDITCIKYFNQDLDLDVNNEGFKMRVSTECGLERCIGDYLKDPINFIADRSFYWIIRDNKNKIVSLGIY